MATIEIVSRVTHRSLMNRSKDQLASRVLELMDELSREREISSCLRERAVEAAERRARQDKRTVDCLLRDDLSAEERIARAVRSPAFDVAREGRPFPPLPERARAAPPPPAHIDQLALDTAREIVALDGREFVGGDCQRTAAIQCAVVAALERARQDKDA